MGFLKALIEDDNGEFHYIYNQDAEDEGYEKSRQEEIGSDQSTVCR